MSLSAQSDKLLKVIKVVDENSFLYTMVSEFMATALWHSMPLKIFNFSYSVRFFVVFSIPQTLCSCLAWGYNSEPKSFHLFCRCGVQHDNERLDKMPIDINGWRAGIADVHKNFTLHAHRPITCPILSHIPAIVSMFLYMYIFKIMASITGPLSLWITSIITYVPYFKYLIYI